MPEFPCVPEFPCLPAAFSACLAACAAAFAKAAHVVALVGDGPRWQAMAADAGTYTAAMTLDRFGDRVKETLERGWGVTLPDPPAAGR